MLSKPIPRWVLAAGFLLTATAGSINAAGLIGGHHQALSHLSGPVTVLGNDLAAGHGAEALAAAGVVAAFFLGCTVSALLIQSEALQFGRRYGVVLMLESAGLVAAWWLLGEDRYAGEVMAALACGLQNAMVSSYSGAVIRTTHVTGMVTDLGIACGQVLRGAPVDRRRAGLYALLVAGFFLGGTAGSLGYLRWGLATLLVPATLTGAAGLACLVAAPRPRAR